MEHISEQIVNKWSAVLDHPSAPKITDPYRREVTARLLENQEASSKTGEMVFETAEIPNVAGDNLGGTNSSMSRYDPILISMVRRAMPKLIAYDVCGVQPMTGPTGLIFAMKSTYANTSTPNVSEALFNEANTAFSGQGTHGSLSDFAANTLSTLDAGLGLMTSDAETDDYWPQMGFEITKKTVGVKTRRLKADYTTELAQDLKAVHNLDAESELANILSQQILNEINREVVRNIYSIAKAGGVGGNNDSTALVDLAVSSGDVNGRWYGEQWKGLQFMMERDAIKIAKDTRRGKGNFVIVSSEIAAALAGAGILDYAKMLDARASLGNYPNETSGTYVGTIGSGLKVYIDPFVDLSENFYCVGYKGTSAWDAGMFYCPWIPLQMTKVTHENSFQPSIGFKTRYGMTEHPFAGSSYIPAFDGQAYGTAHNNSYYRIAKVANLI